jgi:hypothetical protein
MQFNEKCAQLAAERHKDDKKFTNSDKAIEKKVDDNFAKIMQEIENTERRCKTDA